MLNNRGRKKERPHILSLLAVILTLLVVAAVLIAVGSYSLLRHHAIDAARAEAAAELASVIDLIETPRSDRSHVYFALLRNQVTYDSAPSTSDIETVVRIAPNSSESPSTVLGFDPGRNGTVEFDPLLNAEIVVLDNRSGRVQSPIKIIAEDDAGETVAVYHGMQRYWSESSARLVMASKITPVDRSIGQIILFTASIVLLLMVALTLVISLAQNRFDQQMREIREASQEISEHGDRVPELPVKEGTELGMLTDQINQMLSKLQARGRLIRQQSFALDHDYREPIAHVIAQARRAMNLKSVAQEDTTASALMKAISEIHDVAQQMDKAARERLEVYRFDLDVTEGESDMLETLDLSELVEEALTSCWMLTEERGVEMRVYASQGILVKGSRSLLTRALANIVRNAVALSDAGKVVEVHVLKHENAAQIHVKDQAGGLPAEILNAINDISENSGMPKSRRPEGVGLGLLIARYVMIAHRGRLSAENIESGAILKLILDPGL